jgi:putative oxidoreductase
MPWLGALAARLIVGYTFMLSGWGKLKNIDGTTEFFTSLGIPAANILAPLVSGWEFIGGLFLIFGLVTRISAGGLAVVMLVAIATAKLSEINDLFDLVSNPEATYFAVFTWLAVSGPGSLSADHLIEEKLKRDIF